MSIAILNINNNVKKVKMLKGKIRRNIGTSLEEGQYNFMVVSHISR
jgi:hypothetical protein